MAVITFMSDFGTRDHYVASVKASIISHDPNRQIIDISHDIRPYDIAHAANVLKNTFREFPQGSVHLIAVDSVRAKAKAVAIELEGHYFVGFDCGLFSLISSNKPDKIRELAGGESTFPAKDVLAKAAISLAQGESLEKLGNPIEQLIELFNRQLKVTKREIAGHIVSVDHYGNLITNISEKEFDKIKEINGSEVRYAIRFGRELFDRLHQFFTDVDSGDCYVMFNSSGDLQIGINKGNASELLGLGIDAPVIIEFMNGYELYEWILIRIK